MKRQLKSESKRFDSSVDEDEPTDATLETVMPNTSKLKQIKEWHTEIDAIMTLFCDKRTFNTAQKRRIKQNSFIYNRCYIDKDENKEKEEKSEEPPKIGLPSIKRLERIFTNIRRKAANVEITEIHFPLGLLLDHFKRINTIEIFKISCNPKFLSHWVPLRQWQKFWVDNILNKGKDSLRKLCLSNVSMTKSQADIILKNLGDLKYIQFFDLSGNLLGPEICPKLSKALKNLKALISLDLSGNCFGNRGASKILDSIKRHSVLQDINLSLNEITKNCREGIHRFLKAKNACKRINLSFNSMKVKGLQRILEALPKNKSLEILNMASNDINNQDIEDIEYFTHLVSSCGLKKINMTLNRIRGDNKYAIINTCNAKKIKIKLDNV